MLRRKNRADCRGGGRGKSDDDGAVGVAVPLGDAADSICTSTKAYSNVVDDHKNNNSSDGFSKRKAGPVVRTFKRLVWATVVIVFYFFINNNQLLDRHHHETLSGVESGRPSESESESEWQGHGHGHGRPPLPQGPQLLQALARRTTVSIGTVPRRRKELLLTLDSIFRQTIPPAKVQVHYSDPHHNWDDSSGGDGGRDGDGELLSSRQQSYPGLDDVIHKARSLLENVQQQKSSSSNSNNVKTEISFHPADPNWMSATKLLGFLYQEWNGTEAPPVPRNPRHDDDPSSIKYRNRGENLENLVIVADDDFVYLQSWLESLLRGHLLFPWSAVALRGWRIRRDSRGNLLYGSPRIGGKIVPDGIWGSFPSSERYIIKGGNIAEPYRVGVVTGVNGILMRPSFFATSGGGSNGSSSSSSSDIFQAPNRDYLSVDDIWYSGHLANKSIERWVVPFGGTGTVGDRDVGTHLGSGKTVIDRQLKAFHRSEANLKTIRYFQDAWKKGDGESLYWSEGTNPAGPKLRGLLPLRHWISENIIIRLYSFMYG
mmetsp:Transcript_34223/g.82398  ORF Transcript_34223/g.82398 Transcript_34223/m.82398 type:complete len:543 (+) Transcript_34223:166-1794(+)